MCPAACSHALVSSHKRGPATPRCRLVLARICLRAVVGACALTDAKDSSIFIRTCCDALFIEYYRNTEHSFRCPRLLRVASQFVLLSLVCASDLLCRRRPPSHSRVYYFADQRAHKRNETVKGTGGLCQCKSNACRRRRTLSRAKVNCSHAFARSINDVGLVESFLGEHTRYLVLLAGFSVGLSVAILLCYLSQQRDCAFACFGMSCASL